LESPPDRRLIEEYKRWQRSNIENTVAMLKSIINLHGEGVLKVASAAYSSLMRQRWRKIAEESNDRSIEELFRRLWEGSKDLIHFEVTQKTSDSLALKVNSCFWADEFRRAGGANIGYELCCMADFYIVEVFNPEISYRRMRTLMQGNNCCDHLYTIYR
jgi:hypothetical protein